jgi:tetratricopeptide (TPR) repeat protein
VRSFGLLLVLSACAASPPAPPPAAPESHPEPPSHAEPEAAADWLRRGASLIKLGETGTHDAFEQAKEALLNCVERDPGIAECQYLLGEACEFTGDETCAAQRYTTAVTESPSSPMYYAPLAQTYLRFKLYDQAQQVLREGIRRIPRELANAPDILGLYRMLAHIADVRGDAEGRVKALEEGAREGGSSPEVDFELGLAYLDVQPPRQVDAYRSFTRFAKRVCSGSAASFYKSECTFTQHSLARLGIAGQVEPEGEPASQPPASVTVVPASVPLLLPPPIALTVAPLKVGEDFTVWGASYALRSRAHQSEVVGEGDEHAITITGYITRTNLPDAPKCSVHRPGRADPEGCVSPLPTFWLGDAPDAAPEDCISVIGWASNFAQVYEAIRAFDRRNPSQYIDGFLGVAVPNPLPAVGAKVTVRGTYGTKFGVATVAIEPEPTMGILTYRSYTVLEQAPELGTLPGVTRKTPQSPSH